MQELLKEIAELIGVSPALVEGSALTLSLLAVIYLTRTLLQTQKTDEKQVAFEERLVALAADSVYELKQQRAAYERNTGVVEKSSIISEELVKAVQELNKTLPEQITAHADSTVKLFMDKADEMHSVTVRRDAEMQADRDLRDANHKIVLEKIDEQRAMIESLVKELTDATDDTTLRAELNRVIITIDEMMVVIKSLVP